MVDPDRLVVVGRVGRPHGLDGAFLVQDASDDPQRFARGARLLADGIDVEVVLSRRAGKGRLAVKLDRPVPHGAELAVRASDLPPAEPDAWYAFELVGLAVEEESGRDLGRIADVHAGVANDNLELTDGTLVPLIDAAVVEVDVTGGRVVLRAGFLGP